MGNQGNGSIDGLPPQVPASAAEVIASVAVKLSSAHEEETEWADLALAEARVTVRSSGFELDAVISTWAGPREPGDEGRG